MPHAPQATLAQLTQLALAFRDQRDWKQFHNPKDVSLSLMLEAAELAEIMQWKNGPLLDEHLAAVRPHVGEELSDVLYWTLILAHDQKIDLAGAFVDKMKKNAEKYPVEKSKGVAKKYTELNQPTSAATRSKGR
jgi:dCTP diphosphatase